VVAFAPETLSVPDGKSKPMAKSTHSLRRYVFAAVFLACAGLIGFAMALQHYVHLEPCPMCVMQRYAFVLCGIVALLAALHNPAGFGAKVYGALVALVSVAGGGVAARQSWIQHFPPKVADCGPDLEFMLDSFPLAQALPMIFRGAGDCSKVQWTFLGLSIPEWALMWFAGIALASLYVILRKGAEPLDPSTRLRQRARS
jgi:protein dithiol:quinone oxidoreductase